MLLFGIIKFVNQHSTILLHVLTEYLEIVAHIIISDGFRNMQICKTFYVHNYCTLIFLIFKYKLWFQRFSAGYWSYAACYFIL